MFPFLKRPLYVLSNKIRGELSPSKSRKTEEKWTADFSSPENSHFDIKTETSYNAYLETNDSSHAEEKGLGFLRRNEREKGALIIGLKKANCIAWVDAPEREYQDHVIEARFCLDSMGGYAAAGIMFRIVEDSTYYVALISSKGYFRFDAVRNNTPQPLIGWTEAPGFEAGGGQAFAEGRSIDFTIAAYGGNFIFLINGRWAAEISDSSIAGGHPAFVLASYEAASSEAASYEAASGEGNDLDVPASGDNGVYTCKARLECFSADPRVEVIEEFYREWKDSQNITAESRLRLAETYAAMGRAAESLLQLRKLWERREEAARSVTATYTEMRSRRELLLGARMSSFLGQYEDANQYIDACLDQGFDNPEGNDALIEKANILFGMEKYEELQDFVLKNFSALKDNPVQYALLGRAFWNKGDYPSAAQTYGRAFELDNANGTYALNAAAAYEAMGKRFKSLRHFLMAGKAFLKKEDYEELGRLIPKLLTVGEFNWKARALVGKWAFGVGDFEQAEAELSMCEKLRRRMKARPSVDPAVSFLRGLLFIRKGQRLEASSFLEEAARLEPDYGLFHFRLAENSYLFSHDAQNPQVTKELKAALKLMPDDGWVNNFAAQIKLACGDLDAAEEYLKKAARTLGEVPAIRMNRGVFCYLKGSLDDALKILNADKRDDPEGLMANCAGNLLVRSGDLEKADEYYRKALNIAPGNVEYISNRASCLIKLGYYAQAEDILVPASPSPEILELISYAASQKGDYSRAEKASLAALEMKPDNLPSLFSLGWVYCNTGRWHDLKKIVNRLKRLNLSDDDADRRRELIKRLDEGLFRIINCADCSRAWKVKRAIEEIPSIKLYAMPPDDYPAGTCPDCGKTYCIACAKKHIDKNNRFICPKCRINLKLSDDGIKKIIYDWASARG